MWIEKFSNPNNSSKYHVDRKEYTVLKVYYSDFTDQMKNDLEEDVDELYKNASPFQANTGNKRINEIKKVDSFSGVIAEYAAVILFNYFIGNCNAVREETKKYSHDDHVDIILTRDNIQRTVEVRSSFVNNGIEFALFKANGDVKGQYFNVIGPYLNKRYKVNYEDFKNYYIRVLFDNKDKIKDDFKAFSEGFYADKVPIYVIGAATARLFKAHGFRKNFNSEGDQVKTPGEYFVIELQHIHDIMRYKKLIEEHSI